MLERLAQEPYVVSRLTFQPLGDSTLESSSRRSRQVAHSGLADQVVGDPERRSGVQHDAPVDQLRRRELYPVVRPAHHGACVFDAQWPSGKGEDGKERHRVGAGPAQARREKPSGVRVVAGGPRERLEPERRPACLLPYLHCRSVIQRRRHLAHQLDALLPPQTADLERGDPLWRQCLLQPAQELPAASRRPCRSEDRQRLIVVAGGAHEVMAQSERALVHPLEIVDRQERRLERPGSPMSGLEDPHRLERRRPRRRIEEDCLQPFAVARALRERSEESRRRRERDLAFGLVADDAEPIRNVDTPRGLREEPALADTGIPDDERRHRPADRGARNGLDKRLELGGPAHERPGHASSVDGPSPSFTRTRNGAQRSPNRLDLDPRGPSYRAFLDLLLESEVGVLEGRRYQSRLKMAGLPHHKTLDEFDVAFQPDLDPKRLAEPRSLRFIERKVGCLILGRRASALGAGFRSAPRETRTPTGETPHKALNLARLSPLATVPEQAMMTETPVPAKHAKPRRGEATKGERRRKDAEPRSETAGGPQARRTPARDVQPARQVGAGRGCADPGVGQLALAPKLRFGAESVGIRPDRAASAALPRQAMIRSNRLGRGIGVPQRQVPCSAW